MEPIKNEKYDSGAVYEAPASESIDSNIETGTVQNVDQLQRHLGNRQVQLIAIGGSIGTALFVSIGNGLYKGGPGSLFIAFVLYCGLMGCINNSMAEMSTYMPVTGGFIRMAGKWVDESFGFMVGWNFFIYEAVLIPFEITALNLVLSFWRDDIPVAAVCAACIVLYAALNVVAVKYYGEAEFWLASGKVLLIGIVFMFTFVTMIGGNPQHDAYGFRNWNSPGAFEEHITTGSLGRFEGFLAALWTAAFTIVGPEYVSMVAGECKRPRVYLKTAFKTMYWRFAIFFIVGALCVGIVIPYNDPTLVGILSGTTDGAGTGAASPYVIAMNNMGISGLPHVTNALLVTSIFSAGNGYVYYATRSLYGLALEGQAPKFLRKCTKNGIPIYCFCVAICFPCLSFLQVSSGSALVLTWLTNLLTAGQIIDYIVICTTYLFFYRACRAQGINRKTLPYFGWAQPYCGWIGLVGSIFVVGTYGYTTFLPGEWDVGTFLSYYMMVFIAPVLYFGWKIIKKTKIVPAIEADLIWDSRIIDAYEETFLEPPLGFWTEMTQIVGIRKSSKGKA